MKFIDVMHPILKLPYQVVFAMLKFTSRFFWGVEIWPRHSYLTEAFIPIKSDLDLSAYIQNSESLASYLKFYGFSKKLIPFIGELNVFDNETIRFIKENDINGFELQRDPILVRRFNVDLQNKKYFSRENAVSYLLMALINDLHKIEEDSSSRIKKWKYHLAQINNGLSKHNLNMKRFELDEGAILFSVTTVIVNLSHTKSFEQADHLRAKLMMFIGFIPKATKKSGFRDLMRPIIAHEADIFCYFIEYLAAVAGPNPNISEQQFAIMLSQMDWVIVKYMKQNHDTSDITNAIEKIEIFKKIVNKYKIENPNFQASAALIKMDLVCELLQNRAI